MLEKESDKLNLENQKLSIEIQKLELEKQKISMEMGVLNHKAELLLMLKARMDAKMQKD